MHVRLGTVLLIGILSLAMVASAAGLQKQYALELRGGYGMIAMKDVNNLTDSLWGSGVTSSTKLSGTPTFGVSLLYRTDPHFLWELGYNAIAGGDWKSNAVGGPNAGGESTLNISGSEFYILPTYMFLTDGALKFGIGAGPDFSFINASRSGTYSVLNFSDGYGRTIGGMVKAYLELTMGEHNGLAISAGYRNHYVDRLRWEDDSGTLHNVQINADANSQNLPVDMSGAFVQIGWRFYYTPKLWKAE